MELHKEIAANLYAFSQNPCDVPRNSAQEHMRRMYVVVDYTLRPPKGTRAYRGMETIKVKFKARPRIQGGSLLLSRIL